MVKSVWPLVSDRIRAAIVRTGIGLLSEVEADLFSRQSLLWVVHDGDGIASVIITQLSKGENGVVCTIVACGGKSVLHDIRLLAGIEKYARAEGCRAMRIIGRKGWARALDEYKQTCVVLEKELG